MWDAGGEVIGWLLQFLAESVADIFSTGVEPSPEARRRASGSPVAMAALAGGVAGAALGAAEAQVLVLLQAAVAGRKPSPVFMGACLGALLGCILLAGLRALDEALVAFPASLPIGVCGVLGTATGALVGSFPGVPLPETALAGAVLGILLAVLFRLFGDHLP